MKQTIVYETERVGAMYRGLVVDMDIYQVIDRTGFYANADDARAAAVSQWRARKNAAVSIAA